MDVAKLVAFYGFDNTLDIGMFSTISKTFYDWVNNNVIIKCFSATQIRFLSRKLNTNELVSFKFLFPREALLKCKNKIRLTLVHIRNYIEDFSFRLVFQNQNIYVNVTLTNDGKINIICKPKKNELYFVPEFEYIVKENKLKGIIIYAIKNET